VGGSAYSDATLLADWLPPCVVVGPLAHAVKVPAHPRDPHLHRSHSSLPRENSKVTVTTDATFGEILTS
jgi:hypothetical protein